MPAIISWEEHHFRVGTNGKVSTVVRSLVFGFVHMVAGVSVGSALALSFAGLWFSWWYEREGVEGSIRQHSLWNQTIFVLIGGLLVMASFLPDV